MAPTTIRRGIGTRLVAGGNSVALLSRDPGKGAELTANLQAVARQRASAQAVPFGSPIRDEVVVLAAPYHAVAVVLQPYATQLEGLGFLGMKLQFTLGTHFQSAWKLLAGSVAFFVSQSSQGAMHVLHGIDVLVFWVKPKV
jgi:predicted dinucleotide-binding enzyme